MDDSEQDKSELPTQYKLKKSREQGQVARGMDLGYFSTLLALLAFLWIAGAGLVDSVARLMRGTLAATSAAPEGNGLIGLTGGAMIGATRPVILLAGIVFAVVLLFELIQTGIVFSGKPLKPDFSRLNPAKGLKRIFTIRILIETAKNVLKLLIYGALTILLIDQAMGLVLSTADAKGLTSQMERMGFRMVAWFLLISILFLAVDQLIVRRDFLKKMRMSRRELRRESRDREGEPRMKRRRKQLHAEFVKISQSLRGIRGADVLIVNPIHYAVALRYDARRNGAPVVVALGSHGIALRLKRLAFLYGIKIIEDRPLAQGLYRRSVIDREIPEQYFRQVATIYRTMRPPVK